MSQYVVCALYKFVRLDDFESLQQPLLNVMKKQDVKGTLLLAPEGINGTVAGTQMGIDALLTWLKKDVRLADIVHKESFDTEIPFYRSKVKLKKEIVTMGIEGIDPKKVVGSYIKPKDWNNLISDPDVVLVDTRNEYEVGIGTFKNAINPNTETFREFPQFVRENLNTETHKKVAMFCTGGIRCEKSTAYLKELGFDEVFHLEGGILKYLEEVPKSESLWEGECFVFDNRVVVNHSLERGRYDQCYACRRPITQEDKNKAEYEQGVSCHQCFDKATETQKKRFRDREKQVQLAKSRGEEHIGSVMPDLHDTRRQEKYNHKNTQRKKP
ncbi:MAG: rhodanese-related sulfurtransferase [Pseudomonadales bacterium]|nr:rhodanese-related sulfurtransferase [Pseudomonadales bacterium]